MGRIDAVEFGVVAATTESAALCACLAYLERCFRRALTRGWSREQLDVHPVVLQSRCD
jgi:hypothetical protein